MDNKDNVIVIWMQERLAIIKDRSAVSRDRIAVMESLVDKLLVATPTDPANLTEDECECFSGAIIAMVEGL